MRPFFLFIGLALMVFMGPVQAMAHSQTVGDINDPYALTSMVDAVRWDHDDSGMPLAERKSLFTLTLQNKTSVDWGDFHFTITDIGWDV